MEKKIIITINGNNEKYDRKKKKKPTQTYYVIDYSLYAKYIYIIYIL